ncbi:MAG TPA: fibronectin type III domain-containing protein, partial [Solirubrobacter sp.]
SVVAGAVSYRVERAADAAGAPGAWAEIASGLAGVSFHDTGLVPNTAYWYRVRATNAGGDGPPSLATTVMTAPAAPGAPTFGAVSAYTVTVVWTAPATGAATYKVERGTSPWGPFTQVAAGVAAFSVVDSAVGANVTYSYRVRGTNAAGLDGDYSPTAAVTTPIDPAVAVPAAPAAPTFSSIGSTSLYVNWTAVPGAVSYGVERAPDASGAPGAWTQIASAVFSLGFGDYGLTANSTYWYRVRATNGGGDGPQSPAAAVMTATAAPGKPSFSGVGPHTVTIAWTASPGGAASYEVERSMLNGSYARVASGLTALSFVDATVAANQAYSYLVRGVNAMGTDGDSSPAATVTTPTDPTVVLPTAPASPTFSPVYSTSLYVNWTAVPGAVSYKLERAPDASGAPGAWTQRQGAVTDLYAYDGGLSANTLYWYRLRATNGGGDGPYSPAASITTAPSAPGTPSFSGVAPYSVTVSWTAPASGASSYKVERSTSQYGTFTQLASGVASTSFVDAGVAANVTYYYRVRGTNASGVDGDYSGVSSVTTPVDPAVALPAAPGGPTYSSVSPTYLYVGWAAAAGAVSYKIERAPDAAGAPGAWAQLTSGVTSVSYFSSGLTANTAYWYRIRATNAGGDGPYSSATAVMTGPGAPGAPTFSGLGPYSVTVSWTAPVSGAATYKVERATAQYGPFTQLAAGTSGLSYVDGGVAANATYFYRVRGTNALGYDGDSSSTTSVATPIDPAIAVPPAPAAPTYSSVSTSYLYV